MFRVSGTLLKGRGPSFLGKIGIPLAYVYAEPIKVTRQTIVDPEYLFEIHQQVQDSVMNIFENHKSEFGYSRDETLEFVTVKQARSFSNGSRNIKKLD